MTYEEFRDHVLDLLNQRSSNGVILDNLYNDQSDYYLRIPSLYNKAITNVAQYCVYTGVIDKAMCMPRERGGGYVNITVPDDYIRMLPVLITRNGRPFRSNGYYNLGGNQVAIKGELMFGDTVLEYVKRPAKLPTVIGADIAMLHLDGTEEQQQAAALYVAEHLCMEDNAYVSDRLHNEYADWVDEMKTRRTAETTYTPDTYGLDGLYGGEWY